MNSFLLQSHLGILVYGRVEDGALVRCLSIITIIGLTLALGIMPLLDNWATAAGKEEYLNYNIATSISGKSLFFPKQ